MSNSQHNAQPTDAEDQYFNSLWQGLSKDDLAKPIGDVSVCFHYRYSERFGGNYEELWMGL